MNNWESIYIYFISGTGNARKSSEWIADEAHRRGMKAVVQQIDRLKNVSFPSNDEKALVGFAFPTHGFNAAPIMLRFISGFPRGLSKDVFLLNTRAGMKLYKLFMPGLSGVALMIPAFILWLKGYRCIGFRPVDLPSNWIPIHPGIKKKVIDSIFIRCEKIVRDFADRLFSGKRVYAGLWTFPVDILISPLALAYYIGGRFFLSKTFVATRKCNNCGICINECPTASIKYVQNRPYWMLSCESCMKCLNNCPERAIEAAHGMAVLFWLIYSALNIQLLMLIIKIFNIRPVAWWWFILSNLIGIAVLITTASILYWIFHYAMGLRPIRDLIRFTSLTALPFWRRYNRKNTNHKK